MKKGGNFKLEKFLRGLRRFYIDCTLGSLKPAFAYKNEHFLSWSNFGLHLLASAEIIP